VTLRADIQKLSPS